ncbi:MAG: hypothetical protein K0Q58_461 [Microbacterium sp.]|nr:hypothetical protein [Microbacterium sp.]
MRATTPKKGPRQLTSPRRPPRSGPIAMPMPRAASYSTMAALLPPLAAPTIVARAVEMKRALPSPQPARNPMMRSTLPLSAHSRANTTISARPMSSVAFAPIRLEIQLVTSMARPVTSR